MTRNKKNKIQGNSICKALPMNKLSKLNVINYFIFREKMKDPMNSILSINRLKNERFFVFEIKFLNKLKKKLFIHDYNT